MAAAAFFFCAGVRVGVACSAQPGRVRIANGAADAATVTSAAARRAVFMISPRLGSTPRL
jgi:hypothetical protein